MKLDEYATSAEIAAWHAGIAVFGIGAIEQHGRHLPIGTDWIAVSELARRVAVELNAILIPAIPFSLSECHGALPGTVWLKPATLAAVLGDVIRSLREQGIRQVLVLNGHGGNFILEPAIQALNHENPDMHIIMPPGLWADHDENGSLFETSASEVHAGEVETSTQLYLHPECVQPELADFVPQVGREFLDYTTMDQINPEGVWGQPSHAEAAKGERAMAALVRAVVAFAQAAFEALK